MSNDPRTILTEADMTTTRTPEELARWVEQKYREIAGPDRRFKEYALRRTGLAKTFYEEVRPLSLLVNKLYPERADIVCTPNLDTNDDFDAIIRDCSVYPHIERKIELTLAIEGHTEHLRMEYFLEHGHVNLLGKVCSTGTKRTRQKVSVEEEMVSRMDSVQKTCQLIEAAAKRKSAKPGRYGYTHDLVIFFDDWRWFDADDDIIVLEGFMGTNVLTLPLRFRTVYVLGWSGRTLLSFGLSNDYSG
jgi:hypothetical protein